jgi:hypothetical protein
MRKIINAKRVFVSLPLEIRQYLEERADYHAATISSEIVRSIRERMEREGAATGKDRASAGAAE